MLPTVVTKSRSRKEPIQPLARSSRRQRCLCRSQQVRRVDHRVSLPIKPASVRPRSATTPVPGCVKTTCLVAHFFYIKSQTMGIQTAWSAPMASPSCRKANVQSASPGRSSVSQRLSRSTSTAASVHPAAASPPRIARTARGVWQSAARLRGRSGTLLFQPDARCSWHHSEISSELARSNNHSRSLHAICRRIARCRRCPRRNGWAIVARCRLSSLLAFLELLWWLTCLLNILSQKLHAAWRRTSVPMFGRQKSVAR